MTARFIDDLVAIEKMQDGLNTNNSNIVVRVQHLPKSYYVEHSDTGYKIGRKNGLPYQLVYESNPNVNWRALNVGDQIQIPSRDVLIPEDPLPHKRIVVDIESQWLVAFEYDQMVFSWAISSGREAAPTYPGDFPNPDAQRCRLRRQLRLVQRCRDQLRAMENELVYGHL